VLYRGYIDDSADKRQLVAVVAGAIVAKHGEWTKFRTAWKRELTSWGIDYFKSSEYYSLSGQFERFRDKAKYPAPLGRGQARKIFDALEAVINRFPTFRALINIVPIQTYREFLANVPTAAEKLPPDPFSLALQSTVMECAFFVKERIRNGNCIGFVSDDGPHSAVYAEAYSNFKLKNPNVAAMMRGMAHLDDKKVQPLQAADIVASIGKDVAFDLIQNPPPTKKRMVSGVMRNMADWQPKFPRLNTKIFQVSFWTWDYLETVLAAQS
jgi:hypothetical protein